MADKYSIKKRFTHFESQQQIELRTMFEGLHSDLTALRTSITGITAQLDADSGVNDTDYAANNDPAALNLEA